MAILHARSLCENELCASLATLYHTHSYMQNPGTSDVYIEHSVQATVARYAPSGFYIASGGMHTAIRRVPVCVCVYVSVCK